MDGSRKKSDYCEFRSRLFAAYAKKGHERLSLVDQSAVDDHLEECPICRATFWRMWAEKSKKAD